MDFGKAFSFPFDDEEWLKKIGIMALITLIPILGPIVLLGWALQIARQIIHNETVHLPDLDFSEQLNLGFMAFVIGFVFALPGMIFQIPIQIIEPIAASLDINNQSVAWMVILVGLCCGGFQFIYSLVAAYILPAAYGNFLSKGRLSAGFELGEIFKLVKAAPVAYLLVLLGGFLSFLISLAGLIACIIGVFLTMAYSQVVVAHLTGQAYKQAEAIKSV